MSDLYRRILLWHKLVAMQTGGLALCSARHRLNRDEAKGWSTTLRNVADEIDTFLLDGTFILDDKGQRVVNCATETSRAIAPDGSLTQEAQHDQVTNPPVGRVSPQAVSPKKAGGLRVATRKKV